MNREFNGYVKAPRCMRATPKLVYGLSNMHRLIVVLDTEMNDPKSRFVTRGGKDFYAMDMITWTVLGPHSANNKVIDILCNTARQRAHLLGVG